MFNKKLICSSLLFFSATAFSEYELSVSVGYEKQDNITRVPVDQIDDEAVTYGADFLLEDLSQNMESNLSYAVDRREYLDDSFESRNAILGTGSIIFKTADNRFSWLFENTERDGLLDVTRAAVPGNLSRTSTYSAGPRVTLGGARRDQFVISATRTLVDVENSDADNEADVAALLWSHAVSNNLSVGSEISYTEIASDLAFIGDIEQQRAALTLERTLRTGSYDLRVGYTVADGTVVVGDDKPKETEYQMGLNLQGGWGGLVFRGSKELVSPGLEGRNLTTLTDDLDHGGANDNFRLDISEVLSLNYVLPIPSDNFTVAVNGTNTKQENQLDLRTREISAYGINLAWVLAKSRFGLRVFQSERQDQADQIQANETDQMSYALEYAREIGLKASMNCRARLLESETPGVDETTDSSSVGCSFAYQIF